MRIADRGFFFAAGFPLPGVMGLRGSSYFSLEHTVYFPVLKTLVWEVNILNEYNKYQKYKRKIEG